MANLKISEMLDGSSLQVTDKLLVLRTTTTPQANVYGGVATTFSNVHLNGGLFSSSLDYRPPSNDAFPISVGTLGTPSGIDFSDSERGLIGRAPVDNAKVTVVQMAVGTDSTPAVFANPPTVGNTLVALVTFWSGGSGFNDTIWPRSQWTDRNNGNNDYSQAAYRAVVPGDTVNAATAIQFGGPNGGSYVVFEVTGNVSFTQADIVFTNDVPSPATQNLTATPDQIVLGFVSGGSTQVTVAVNSGGPIVQSMSVASSTRSVVGYWSDNSINVTATIPDGPWQTVMGVAIRKKAGSATNGVRYGLREIPAANVGAFSMITKVTYNAILYPGSVFGPAVAVGASASEGSFIGRTFAIVPGSPYTGPGGGYASSSFTTFPNWGGSECTWFRVTVQDKVVTHDFSDNGVVWNTLATQTFTTTPTHYGYALRDAGSGTGSGRIVYFDSTEFPNARW